MGYYSIDDISMISKNFIGLFRVWLGMVRLA